jgi:hypothetical protein
MYVREGEVEPGDEAKVARYERKLFDWKRDVVVDHADNQQTAEDMSHEMIQHLQTSFWHCNMLLRNYDTYMTFFSQNFRVFPRAMLWEYPLLANDGYD